MADIFEKVLSRATKIDGTNTTEKRLYSLKDYTNDALARAALISLAPTTVSVVAPGGTITLGSPVYDLKPKGRDGNYEGVVDYKHPSATPQQDRPVEENDEKIRFSFHGGSLFFTKAIAQAKYDPDGGGTAKDVGLAINVETDGTVKGAEVAIPSLTFNVPIVLNIGATASAINTWTRNRIAQIHTYNDATFRGLNTGECLFLGFTGEARVDGLFDLDFEFAVSIEEDFTAANSLDTGRKTFSPGVIKKGFDLLWIQYDSVEDTTDNVIVPEAQGAYIAQVFEDSDFSTIGVTV